MYILLPLFIIPLQYTSVTYIRANHQSSHTWMRQTILLRKSNLYRTLISNEKVKFSLSYTYTFTCFFFFGNTLIGPDGKKSKIWHENFKVCNFSIKPYNLIIIYIRLDYIMQCLNPLNNVCRASLVTHRECLDTVSIADQGRSHGVTD